ncbi:MAG: hypothetical protein WBX25_13475 [Rhodomicrobium sp.]
MQELSELARSGTLGAFIFEPPRFLSAENGVLGVALSYDTMLVAETARRVRRDDPRTLPITIEFSTLVAARLARFLSGKGSSEDDFQLQSWWSEIALRRFGRYAAPVLIEVTVAPDFPRIRQGDSREFDFFEDYRIVRRRARRSQLHYAEGGGRFFPRRKSNSASWGTLGGFLEALDVHSLFAVTAAHVAQDGHAYGTPAFLAGDSFGLRGVLNHLGPNSSWLLPRVGWESGQICDASPASFVPPGGCHSGTSTSGLDAALAAWPRSESARRRSAAAVSRGQLSQAIPLQFVGASSGEREVKIASLSVWHSYGKNPGGPMVCIRDCIQIKLPYRPFLQEDVSKEGDSGAWLMAEGSEEPQWIGLLVGGDGDRSGIVPADRIIDHFSQRLGPLRALI